MKSGNNYLLTVFNASSNPNLTCIEVDDVAYSNTNWISGLFAFDAQTSFSTNCNNDCYPVGINEYNSSNYNIYPNPTSNQLTIDTELEISEITIIDITGKTIKTITTDFNIVDVSNLTNGIYFIKIINKEGSITKKFVKQ